MDRAWRPSSLPSCEQFDQCLGRTSRRSRILACHDSTVDQSERYPIGCLLVDAADSLQLILNKERHDVGQTDRGFFAIGKASYTLSLDERLAPIHYAMKDSRRMTDS